MIWVLIYILIGLIISPLKYWTEKRFFGQYAQPYQRSVAGLLVMLALVALIWPVALISMICIG